MEKSRKLRVLEVLLRYMSQKIIQKYDPKIIGITGSVGKTTTKEMVWKLLSKYHSVRKNEKNYNNEIGVPLTIIGAHSGGNSIFRWLLIFLKWLWMMIFKIKYPEILVLEMGADRPGDIKYLCGFIPLDVGVITNVGISHLEYFKTKKAVAKEKGTLLRSLATHGLAVLNNDDAEIVELKDQIKANIITYGLANQADMQATDIKYSYSKFSTKTEKEIKLIEGIQFKFNHRGNIIPVKLNHALGYPHIYAAMIAMAVAEYFKLNMIEVVNSLEDFVPPKGRMVLVKGIKKTAIIDDTYNSAPDSVHASLNALDQIEAHRKIVVMGDMLELGNEEVAAHKEIGRAVADSNVDYFVAVGERIKESAKEFQEFAQNGGALVEFKTPMEAGTFIQHLLEEGDVILVKGSQGMRMEKVVEEIMADPNRKNELLIRQEDAWTGQEFVQP